MKKVVRIIGIIKILTRVRIRLWIFQHLEKTISSKRPLKLQSKHFSIAKNLVSNEISDPSLSY
jgi:hypothetical protein